MEFHVTLTGSGDLTTRIYRQLLDAILDGRLRPGERLPASRELAERLAVARNTVATAYERLTAEGYLVARVGAGTFVAATVSHTRPRASARGGAAQPRHIWRSIPASATASTSATAQPATYDFGVGTPDVGLFPFDTWRRLISGVLRPSVIGGNDYGDPAGHGGLRTAIARHIGVSRSVRAGADDVVVTQGAQQALDLIGRVLIEPGDRVAVEEPGYPPVRHLFQSLGARVVGVPVDNSGLVVSRLPASTRLVYVTPSHQFPLGTAMSLERRQALLAWAERHDAVVIEDDYDSEFRYSDRPLEPLQSIDRSGRVIYVGSFSKTMLPVLRLGFLIAPPSLRSALRTAKQLTDWHGESATQAALARFIDEGLLARHIRRATRHYALRHEQIATALATDFTEWLIPVPARAGLHLCARAVSPVDIDAVLARSGVSARSLATYCAETPPQSGLVLGYGSVDPTRITAGLHLLRSAFASP